MHSDPSTMSSNRAIGIDAGSTTTKTVVVDNTGEMIWHHLEPTDPRMEEQAQRLVTKARAEAKVAADAPIVATGYGRKLVPNATHRVTEITCHARGVFESLGHGGTLIDIGGQDSKVIVIGSNGGVRNFTMNDKCAAGTGRFLEVVADRLHVPLGELSQVALATDEEVAISSTCTVFAESEIVSLLAHGKPIDHIVRGLFRSLLSRITALAKSTGIHPPVMLSGGVARSEAVRQMLSEALSADVQLPEYPQLMGAYGAVLIGMFRTSQAD